MENFDKVIEACIGKLNKEEPFSTMGWGEIVDYLGIDYHPDNYCYKDGKLYYLLNEMYKKDPKHSLEEEGLFYWINSSTLNKYLIDNNLPKLEHVLSKAEANKKVVLLGVKYW